MLSNGGIPPNGTELHDGEEYNIPVALRQLKDPITEPYHIKCETIVIPPINPNLEFMNEEKYRGLKKEDFANDSDIATRKCVLRLIQEKPELWARKKVRVEVGKWEEIAIELFKRFGALCDIDHIRQIFGLAKQELREKLIESIKAKDAPYETEQKLAEWVLYYDIRFYREVLKELEDNLRSQTSIDTFEAIVEADAPCHLDGIVRVREVTKENGSIEKVTEMLAPLVLDKNDTGTTRKLELPARLPGLKMSLEDYQVLLKEQFQKNIDLNTRKLIIAVIEQRPSLWNHKNLFAPRREWEEAAVELYLRSGLILSVELMGDVFNEAKENLRKLLYISIMKGHDAKQTELELDGWALYQEMKFFRIVTKTYEHETLQMYNHLEYNKRVVHGENQFSDLMVPSDQDLYNRLEELLETTDNGVRGVLGSVVEAMEVFVENPRDTLFQNVQDYFERFHALETERCGEKENQPL